MESSPAPLMARETKPPLMSRAPFRRLAPALTILACLLAAPSAMAATASVDAGQDRLELTAANGERNLLTVTGSGGTYTLEDTVSNITRGIGLHAARRQARPVLVLRARSSRSTWTCATRTTRSSTRPRSTSRSAPGTAPTSSPAVPTATSSTAAPGDDLLDGGLGAGPPERRRRPRPRDLRVAHRSRERQHRQLLGRRRVRRMGLRQLHGRGGRRRVGQRHA